MQKSEKILETPDWLRYGALVAFDPKCWKELQARIRMWSEDNDQLEWAWVLTGTLKEVDGRLEIVADGFHELNVYQAAKGSNSSEIIIEMVHRIAKHSKTVVGILNLHPDGDLRLNWFDLHTFMDIDLHLGQKLVYIVVGPDFNCQVYHFGKFWDSGAFTDLSSRLRSACERSPTAAEPAKKRTG